MTTWTEFLQQQSLYLSADTNNAFAPEWQSSLQAGFVCPIEGQAILVTEGDDAATFLHSQLTNDIVHLGSNEVRLASYCTAKGRMLASFTMWKSASQIFLQMSQELLPTIQKRLQMYALRAKFKVSPATELVALGLGGAQALQAVQPWFDAEQLAALLPNGKLDAVDAAYGALLRLPDSLGQVRLMWLLDQSHAANIWQAVATTLRPTAAPLWDLLAIHAGIARIESATVEKFVPQMINFELVGGVNFKKGCYPGQEIVARSQYLGKLKRRMYLVHSPLRTLSAGMEVFSTLDPDQPCGMLVNVAINPAGGSDCLVELKSAMIAEGQLQVGGDQLQMLALPYAFPTEQ